MQKQALTIGELAKRCNVSTSLLRYYEKENLLLPSGRTESGYRLYSQDAERTLRFIRSAQRYGFSLGDIKLIVGAVASCDDALDIVDLAEHRFLDIERRLTEMLVLRHELELFLDDLSARVGQGVGAGSGEYCRELVEQVCAHDTPRRRSSSVSKLLQRLHCNLASPDSETVFDDLRGRHLHMWREEDGYCIQYPSNAREVRRALEHIATGESDCGAHLQPRVSVVEGGVLFRARGPNAFLYAQLFMALEAEDA